MSLPRNNAPNSLDSQPHTDLTKPQLDLNDLYRKVLSLREQDRQEAEDKLQVALLLATTEKMCRTLTDFMTATERELQKMNDNQLNTLNLQEQYRKEIKGEVDKILLNTYMAIKENQQAVFDSLLADLKSDIEDMKTDIDSCTAKCNEAVGKVENDVNRLRRITCLGDLMFYLSPVLVLIDVVLRGVEIMI